MAENLTSFRMFLASCTGNAQNTIYRTSVMIANAEDLQAACRKDHVCVAFENCRRGNDNYIRGYALAADCDNDFTEDPAAWITPATVAERLPGVAFYAVKSRNCDKVKHPGEPGEKSARPRYHYYFPLLVPVEGYTAARNLTDSFLYMFPMFDDEGTKPAQFFYGHVDPVAEYHPGELDISQYVRENPIEREPEPEVEPEPEAVRSLAAVSDDFAALNVHDMLDHISASCDYKTWREIGMAINAAGLPFEIWDSWSSTAKDKYPGVEKTRRKWLTFKDGKITFGTLFYIALQNGWTTSPDKLTGIYKANHEAAETYKKCVQAFRKKHREEHIAALTAVGVDCAGDPYKYTWTLSQDGSIDTVTYKETGEIVYTKPAEDQQQTESIPANHPDAEERSKAKPHLTISGYDDVEIRPIDFLIYPWFPRGYITAVQGDSGSSKSTFMYAVGAIVTTGKDLLNVPCEDPGNVMFITIEDDASDIKVSFQDAGGDLSKLRRILEREQIAKLNFSPAGIKEIDRIIKEENIKLLVLDPVQQFLTGDSNKASETRPQMARLMNIAAENNIAIAIIEHLGKDTSRSALHRAIGSVDINASTRSVLQVVTDPEDDHYKIVFTVKSNLAAFHDVQRAIRYQVVDHPGSYDHETKKRARFRGHAEFTEVLPEYNERLFRKAQKKADEAEEKSLQAEIDYHSDPLVLTVRALVAQNPNGLFIGFSDLIERITEKAGRCPYDQTQSKRTGIKSRIAAIREQMMDDETIAIQMDTSTNALKTEPYRWNQGIKEPNLNRERGVTITPIKNGTSGVQQTEM